ncbi:MAG: phosphoribosylformylglycinamidine synthase subunit PurQ, partial [Nannocystaceae bacterium]
TLVKLGALPALGRAVGEGLARPAASLVANERLGYRDAWVRLAFDADSPCVFTRGLGELFLDLPSRHGEGKLVFADDATRAAVEAAHLIPARYVDDGGEPTEAWPANPNGSVGGAAGLCDESGRVFGLMPHPEAYLDPENHPRWRAQAAAGTLPAVGLGLHVLAGGVRAVIEGR